MGSYFDRLKQYFWFSREELKDIGLVILVFAFVFSLKEWIDGAAPGKIAESLAISLVIVFVSIFVYVAAQRLYGIYRSYRVEVKIWWYGLVLCLILGILSRGYILFLAAAGIFIHHLPAHRLGRFRYGTNVEEFAWISCAGPFAAIIFATIIKQIQISMPFIPLNPLIAEKIFFFNWMLAGVSLLPIPPLPGSMLFFMSRLWYAFIAGAIIGYLVLISINIYSYIFALVIGGLTWLLFYIFFERVWG